MKTIVIANNKGGCGKTTSTYYLGLLLASFRLRTLLIDFDPQHNLSDLFGHGEEPATIGDVLGGAASPTETIPEIAISVASHLYLAPAAFDLANVALGLLNDPVGGRMALNKALRLPGMTDRYDAVLVDCAPEAGILLVNSLLAADGVLLTAEPEAAALAGVARVAGIVHYIRTEMERDRPAILGAIATRVDGQTVRHREGLSAMRRNADVLLRGTIPERNGALRDQELRLSYTPVAEWLATWIKEATP